MNMLLGFGLMFLCVALAQSIGDKWGLFLLSVGAILGIAIAAG